MRQMRLRSGANADLGSEGDWTLIVARELFEGVAVPELSPLWEREHESWKDKSSNIPKNDRECLATVHPFTTRITGGCPDAQS